MLFVIWILILLQTGRLDFNTSRVTGHKGPVLDIKWNPFNDNIIASCSDDCTVKLWYIPDGGLATHLTEWLVDLHGHKRRVGYVEWHPTAENVLVSAGFDHLVSITHLPFFYSYSRTRTVQTPVIRITSG